MDPFLTRRGERRRDRIRRHTNFMTDDGDELDSGAPRDPAELFAQALRDEELSWARPAPNGLVVGPSIVAASDDIFDLKADNKGQPSRPIAPDLDARIVGGRPALIRRFPYMVSLQRGKNHACGATLISRDILLTAAHCHHQFDRALIGRYSIDSEVEIRYGTYEIRDVPSQWSHPQYQYSSTNPDISHDMMILLLGDIIGGNEWGDNPRRPVNTELYPPLRINKNPSTPPNKGVSELEVVGWGTTDKNGTTLSSVLRQIELQYVPNPVCQKSGGWVNGKYYSYNGFIQDNMLCALSDTGDACLGKGVLCFDLRRCVRNPLINCSLN